MTQNDVQRRRGIVCCGLVALAILGSVNARAQSAATLAALQGLTPVSVLPATKAGKAALAANLSVTAATQTGAAHQPTLLAFPAQQLQALHDAFVTDGNAAGLADGLGSKLGTAYQALAHVAPDRSFTNVAPSVAALIAYTNETTAPDSNAAKYFLANATTDGTAPASPAAAAILASQKGSTDVFGKAYGHPAGSAGAGRFGNARPFQTEPSLTVIAGTDYFGRPTVSTLWLQGPLQKLIDSPSFPSGHTTYGYAESLVLALLVPQRYPQQMARAAEYGNDRIVLGAHYAMDVIGGRALALYDIAHLLANDPAYVGQPRKHAPTITDYPAALLHARADLSTALQTACGAPLPTCAGQDTSRFHDAHANAALIAAMQTYGLPVVYQKTAHSVEDVGKIAPEAGNLLTAAFPSLGLAAADRILTETEGPGGGFLDNGSAFGLYSRLNLYAAAIKAMQTVSRSGSALPPVHHQ